MSPKRPTIAIIEDDDAFREALAGMLESFGYRALEFESGQAFLDSRQLGSVSCVISDIQMPRMSGLELYDRIAALEEPIPMLLITALPNREDRKHALNAGVICYLEKPFDEQHLLACIQTALKKT